MIGRAVLQFALLVSLAWYVTPAAIAADGQQKLDEIPGFVIDFEYAPPIRPHITIPISINHSKPLLFVLDTGCNAPLFIDRVAAASLHLTKSGVASTIKQGNLAAEEVSVRSIELIGRAGKATIDDDTALVTDLRVVRANTATNDFGGVLGLPLFLKLTARFDFATRTLTLFSAKHQPYSPLGAAVLPLRPSALTDLLSVDARVNSVTCPLLIDTGSPDTSIPMSAVDVATVLARSMQAHMKVDGSYGLNEELLVSELHIGDLTERRVAAVVESGDRTPRLGLDLLSRFIVTIDARNKLLTLVRGTNYASQCRLKGISHIGLVLCDGKFFVKDVKRSSAADEAGIAVGDTLVLVDGQRLDSLTFQQAGAALNGIESTTAVLQVKRGDGKPQEKRFTRSSEFSGQPSVFDGLALWKPAKQAFNVETVAKNSVADRAGIRAGDVLVEIGGKDASRLTPDEFTELTGRDSLKLRVKRKGEGAILDVTLVATQKPSQ
jgi:hypothetical protein